MRKSNIKYRELVGLIPRSRMTKAQKTFLDDNQLEPDQVEFFFGRIYKYYYINKLKP